MIIDSISNNKFFVKIGIRTKLLDARLIADEFSYLLIGVY